MLQFCLFESLERKRGRSTEVRAAAGNDLGVELIDCFEDGFVIDGERGLDEGTPGKGDQPDPVFGEGENDVLRRELCPGQAIGRQIVGHHAARGVNRDNEIARIGLGLDLGEAEDGAGKSGNGGDKGKTVKGEDCPAPTVTAAADEPGRETRGD